MASSCRQAGDIGTLGLPDGADALRQVSLRVLPKVADLTPIGLAVTGQVPVIGCVTTPRPASRAGLR
jgi:hypothetical protein